MGCEELAEKKGYEYVNNQVTLAMTTAIAEAERATLCQLMCAVLAFNAVIAGIGAGMYPSLPLDPTSNPISLITYEMVLTLLQLMETKQHKKPFRNLELKAGCILLLLPFLCVV